MEKGETMKRKPISILVLVTLLAAIPAVAGDFSAQAAFERLKGLAGTWTGKAPAEGGGSDATHVFQVSANGTVVMETMFPGTDHEMINMYHLDGESLMLTHYCAGGNQPRMRLASGSTANEMVFEFDGGTNLDPEKDSYIHDARLVFDGDMLESNWVSWSAGKENHKMVFRLHREGS
jgi:hypothetical protein